MSSYFFVPTVPYSFRIVHRTTSRLPLLLPFVILFILLAWSVLFGMFSVPHGGVVPTRFPTISPVISTNFSSPGSAPACCCPCCTGGFTGKGACCVAHPGYSTPTFLGGDGCFSCCGSSCGVATVCCDGCGYCSSRFSYSSFAPAGFATASTVALPTASVWATATTGPAAARPPRPLCTTPATTVPPRPFVPSFIYCGTCAASLSAWASGAPPTQPARRLQA